jgi:murein DD-endopeptidase MepM/ murein hydrolase activator NlpD
MAGLRITSTFGSRRHPLWGVVQLHAGVDAISDGGTLGAAVNATAGGTVVGVDSRVAYGTAVIVDHGGRLATVYAHLASVDVAVGDVVNRGDRLGGAGATGFATGAHLHYEIRSNGAPIDPTSYLSGTSSTRSAEVGHVFHWPTSTTTP